MEAYNAWDPEKPRSYDNLTRSRNDEEDVNGCFPGQATTVPNRPDINWAPAELNAIMEELKKEPSRRRASPATGARSGRTACRPGVKRAEAYCPPMTAR